MGRRGQSVATLPPIPRSHECSVSTPETPFCRDTVPRRLYKFMRCDTPERLGYVRDLLEHRRLKYSAITTFNDPFEARPYIQIPGRSHEEQRAAMLRHIHDVSRVATVPVPRQLREYVEAGEFDKARALLQEAIRTALSGHPVACLAGTRRSILMWSLYADSHKGACVHLSGRIEPLRTAWPIRYRTEYPSLDLTWPHMAPRAFTDVCILTKSVQWRHEQEYRLISPVAGEKTEVIFSDDAVGTLLPGTVAGITLGALMPAEAAAHFTKIAAAKGLPAWRAQRSDLEYRLTFHRIGP